MISGIFHEGSGLGNQLFRYITTRTAAEDLGYEWGMAGECKGNFFLNLDVGKPVGRLENKWEEKKIVEDGIDIRSYDPDINFIRDNTLIDGEFQDDKYWRHKLRSIDKWLSVDSRDIPNDVCVIGFRGGEYYTDPKLGLPYSYYEKAMSVISSQNPNMRFEVHTDDPQMARSFFPNLEIINNGRLSHSNHSNMGYNWRSMRYAKYAIIANSSFYILPRILSGGYTLAPRYWARYNSKVWALPSNYYKEFAYI